MRVALRLVAERPERSIGGERLRQLPVAGGEVLRFVDEDRVGRADQLGLHEPRSGARLLVMTPPDPKRDAQSAEPKKDESGPELRREVTRAKRFAEAQARTIENHAETFRKLAQ